MDRYCYHSTNAASAADGLAQHVSRHGCHTAYAAARAVLARAAQGHNARQCNYARRVAEAILRDDWRTATTTQQ